MNRYKEIHLIVCFPVNKGGQTLVSAFVRPGTPKEGLGNLWCPSGTGLTRDFATEVPCPAGGKPAGSPSTCHANEWYRFYFHRDHRRITKGKTSIAFDTLARRNLVPPEADQIISRLFAPGRNSDI